jgi:L-fuconolactonase
MITKHEAWLLKTKEDPLSPELPICDSHHHLWDMPNNRYMLEDLFRDIGGGHNIVRTVLVENESVRKKGMLSKMEPVAETVRADHITNFTICQRYGNTRVADGIVGFADFTFGSAVKEVLKAHIAASDRFRVARQLANWEEHNIVTSSGDRGLLLNPRFRDGFACLGALNLCFETFLFHPQLPDLVDLAQTFPDIIMILEHTGGPIGIGPYADNRRDVFEKWQSGMANLADCPNVRVKLGGLGMPFCGFGWNERSAPPGSAEIAETVAPYFLWCIEQFGADRCIFESNFPVDKVSYSYTVLWNAFKRVTEGLSSKERNALFYDTAVKTYRL